MFIKDTMKVKNRETGKTYDCFTQSVDLNNNGNYVMRYNIGINGYTEWSFVHAIYDNETFNKMYEVIGQ